MPIIAHAWLRLSAAHPEREEGNPMRDLLKALALIAMLLACCCSFLYFSGTR